MRLPSLSEVDEPLYVRLKMALRDVITGMQPGDRLPSEHDLCAHYGLSRATIRLALSSLEYEGILERRQGQGTFVAQPKHREILNYLRGFTEEVTAQGSQASTQLISFESLIPDLRVAAYLAVLPPAQVYKIRRLRCADHVPICYQVTYLPCTLYPDLQSENMANGSLYQHLREAYNQSVASADQVIDVVQADPYRAHFLGVAVGTPLLVCERLAYAETGERLEFTRSFYDPGKVRLQFRTDRELSQEGTPMIALRNLE